MCLYFAFTMYTGPAKRPGPAMFAKVIEPNDAGFVETPTTAMLRGANVRASSSRRYRGREAGRFIASELLGQAQFRDQWRPLVVFRLDEVAQVLRRAATAHHAELRGRGGELLAGDDLVD